MIKEIDQKNIDEMINELFGTTEESFYSIEGVFKALESINFIGYYYTMGFNGTVYWCSIFDDTDKRRKKPTAVYESNESMLDAIYLTIGFFISAYNRTLSKLDNLEIN